VPSDAFSLKLTKKTPVMFSPVFVSAKHIQALSGFLDDAVIGPKSGFSDDRWGLPIQNACWFDSACF
jgi:hypothetical protein